MKNLTLANEIEIQQRLLNLKESVNNLIDNLIINYSGNQSVTYIGKYLSIQYGSTEDLINMNNEARKNNLSIIDFSYCEFVIQSYYFIKGKNLIVVKYDYNPQINFNNLNSSEVSNLVYFQFYHPYFRYKINSDICFDTSISVSTPIKNPYRLDKELYTQLNIDPLDPKDKVFKKRCSTVIDPQTNLDTTVNYRRKNYYNGTINCLCRQPKNIFDMKANETCQRVSCRYGGVDEYNYAICNCSGASQLQELSHNILDDPLLPFSDWNFEIINCYNTINFV